MSTPLPPPLFPPPVYLPPAPKATGKRWWRRWWVLATSLVVLLAVVGSVANATKNASSPARAPTTTVAESTTKASTASAASPSVVSTTIVSASTSTTVPTSIVRGPIIDDHHPNPTLTPGAIFDGVTAAQVCVAGYSTSARAVSQSGKDQVYAEYSITSHPTGAYEIDHLIALELGGSNDIRNLWPEPYGGADNAHIKDAIENTLHADVCAGRITLAVAQREIVVWDDVTRSYPSPELTPTATDAPSTASTTTQTTAGGLPTIKPGAYCTPIGAYGTYNGLRYLCATTNAQGVPYSGGRAHWRQG